jgi:hypothetical protein
LKQLIKTTTTTCVLNRLKCDLIAGPPFCHFGRVWTVHFGRLTPFFREPLQPRCLRQRLAPVSRPPGSFRSSWRDIFI